MSGEKQIEEMVRLIETTCSERISEAGESILRCPFSYGCNECTAVALYNAGYRKQSGWISVEERLPENYGPVLVACEGLTIGGAAPIAIGSYGGGFWSLADADGTCYLTKYMHVVVTHWMPLPEPPKKGGE
jgi:hypothetical protein